MGERGSEFSDFSIHFLNQDHKYGCEEPVEGYIRLCVIPERRNKIRDICVNCLGYARLSVSYDFAASESSELKRFFNETQRNATQFDSGGIPPGEYEFPFSFDIPRECSSSIKFERHQFGTIVFRGTIAYQVTALLLNEGDTLQEPTLRATATFVRYVGPDKSLPAAPVVATEHITLEKERTKISVKIPKSIYCVGEAIPISIRIKRLHQRYWVKKVKISLVQEGKISIENEVATLCQVNINEPAIQTTLTPDYKQVQLISSSSDNSVTHLYHIESTLSYPNSYHSQAVLRNALTQSLIPSLKESVVLKESEKKTFSLDIGYSVQVQVFFSRSVFLKTEIVSLSFPIMLSLPCEHHHNDILPRYYSDIAVAKYTTLCDADRNLLSESKIADIQRLRKRAFIFQSSSNQSGNNENFFRHFSDSILASSIASDTPLEEEIHPSPTQSICLSPFQSQSPPGDDPEPVSPISSNENHSPPLAVLPPSASLDFLPSYYDVVTGMNVYNKIQMGIDKVSKLQHLANLDRLSTSL